MEKKELKTWRREVGQECKETREKEMEAGGLERGTGGRRRKM